MPPADVPNWFDADDWDGDRGGDGSDRTATGSDPPGDGRGPPDPPDWFGRMDPVDPPPGGVTRGRSADAPDSGERAGGGTGDRPTAASTAAADGTTPQRRGRDPDSDPEPGDSATAEGRGSLSLIERVLARLGFG